MSLFRKLFGSFPDSENLNSHNPHKQRSLSENIVRGVINDFKRVASDIENQINRKK